MIQIIHKRQSHIEYHYGLQFDHLDGQGGYCFDCTVDGVVDTTTMNPAAFENFHKCVGGEHKVAAPYVTEFVRKWTDPAVGICVRCKEEVPLYNHTNECECGELYNFCGQELAPREQWGEETGEHWTECW